MHKVMNRAKQQPGGRPPGRRDARHPGGAPPRTPGGGTARTTAPGGRPPGSPGGNGTRTRTRPTDGRPPAAPSSPTNATGTNTGATGTATHTGTASHGTTGTLTAPAPPPAPTPAVPGTRQAPDAPTQTPRRPLCPPPATTDVFADRLLAVLSGQRPVHWMLRHTAGRAYDELAHLAERGPLRTRGTRPVVRDIGYYVPRAGAIEVFARIGAGDQLRAMAFRLEQGPDLRWRCTAVELGGPRTAGPDDD
ncbi:Rv3235 family protein [Streptomyces sp. NPDC087903]|uniref:Rv3235 family protein n=1 Tax=Streptomyces sp. NPDC087903 TaxID=3365819 RepID=UPI003812C07D